MRKLIVEAEVPIDGIVNNPDMFGEIFKYHSEDVTEYLNKLLFRPDALILGRKTYEVFAQVWPERKDEMADRINSMPKYVASKTLKQPLSWNSSLIQGDVADEVRKLKQEPGKSLLQYGIGELTKTMLKSGLIDEIHLNVFPFTFGKGDRWFDILGTVNYELLESKSFSSGVVHLRYKPKYNS